ncbi:hypothetical protein [Methylomonas methanica]|uniref:Uncharacterized protein n=1 Tax=Methylomonas methanica TaxID=421 RepID=A0A177MBE2_METMH|nr:hypothetical protein [Methylomonas methanica]OAI02864.1 hypothetical protein A1332_02920 [Methylomonas methanica]
MIAQINLFPLPALVVPLRKAAEILFQSPNLRLPERRVVAWLWRRWVLVTAKLLKMTKMIEVVNMRELIGKQDFIASREEDSRVIEYRL